MIKSIRNYIEQHKENTLYLTIWFVVFTIPIMAMLLRITDTYEPFNWNHVISAWKILALFFIVFLIHNIFLLPKIVYQKKRKQYFAFLFVLLILFTIAQYFFHPVLVHNHFFQSIAESEIAANLHNDISILPPHIAAQVLVVHVLIVILMFGMNFGVKMFFNSNEDFEKLRALQQKSLEQQLIYLKYQINPHFFMNTLNNIHALVDIDPEKAKTSIIVLSKMMRYVLYEGNHKLIPLQKESEFIGRFITIMRMRYTEKVKVNFKIPDYFSVGEIPPLLLICFVENAFKHGVTYQQECTIDISLNVKDEKICFTCFNKKPQNAKNEQGGLGLKSAKQRLNLIYPNNHKLTIVEEKDFYQVTLDLPLNDKTNLK
ncbi:sensor histidine kinase [Prevotella disiens]|uniref:Histidine kinase n=3 Tax=Prevotella disiens TaxID=28130 RepID=A0A096ARV1_9BACT|nr:histidine kinase [Prevotella disiens]KGF49451.1 histidine kinase [Prevotella disiens DNF00882]RGK98262.1 histidine kinase [Prevotella disiens]